MQASLTALIPVAGWLIVTLAAYLIASVLYRRAGGNPALHPLPITALLVGACLMASQTPVETYRQHAHLLHWLLGPATVALAIPLYRQLHQIRSDGIRLMLPILAGGCFAAMSATAMLYVFDVPEVIMKSMLTKSITTPLAIETSQLIGGAPPLATIFVIITGIVGAICAGTLFRILRLDCPKSQGIALGTVAHAVGTSRAVQFGESSSAYATVALCINGILTAIVLPLLFS